MNSRLKPNAPAAVSCNKINPKYPCLNLSPYHSYEPISVVQIYHPTVTPFNEVLVDLLIVPLLKGLPAIRLYPKRSECVHRGLPLDSTLNEVNVFTEAFHWTRP